jgi:DNA-binding FrmR family transcriptional regulator
MYGYTQNKDDYLKRLRRIEGQVRGLQRMIDEDQYCIDIVTQVAATTTCRSPASQHYNSITPGGYIVAV